MKTLLRILALCLLLGVFLTGCKDRLPEEVVPTYGDATGPSSDPTVQTLERNGVRFTLPREFNDYSDSPMGRKYEFLYAADYVGVYGTRYTKETASDLESFCQAMAAEWNTQAVHNSSVWTAYYVDHSQNEPQAMVCAFYESGDAFWMIQAYCPQELYGEYEEFMYECVLAAQILE